MAFDDNLMAFADDVAEDVTRTQRLIAMYFLGEVVKLSPVGNRELWAVNKERKARGKKGLVPKGYTGGAFRGNHIVSIGQPDYSYNADHKDKNGGETINTGTAAIQNSKPYTVIIIQNNMPYAVRLEEGHSKQAPAGWFMSAFARVSEAFA
ncbi:hypothetical protein [Carnimonas bestiolae]|uniref:hypothetical protein n=1 Tax=Carnimonas bestiolae TaxID=3402172 RepID=UPI003EDC1A16